MSKTSKGATTRGDPDAEPTTARDPDWPDSVHKLKKGKKRR